jgi:hypothetical protein
MVQQEAVAFWVLKWGHVADAGIDGVGQEGDASGLELGAGGVHVLDE